MKKEDVLKLPPGLYRIHWRESNGGGSSLAAVGITRNGNRWLAPINWVKPSDSLVTWRAVEKAEILER